MGSDRTPATTEEREGWNPALPEHLPRRTVWPVAAAFGTVLIFWATVTSYLILAIGLGVLALAAIGWINEIRREGHADE